MWKPYPPAVEAAIDAAAQAGAGGLTVTIRGNAYDLDLTTLVQRKQQTGWRRRIRSLPAGPGAGGGGAGGGGGGAAGGGDGKDGAGDGGGGGGGGGTCHWEVVDASDLDGEDCPICITDFSDASDGEPVRLKNCAGHWFHRECIEQCFKVKTQCPVCSQIYGELEGAMPDGRMTITVLPAGQHPIEGDEDAGTIVVDYDFPNGTQTDGAFCQ